MRVGTKESALERIWRSGEFIGDQKPTARATIRPGNVRLTPAGDYGDFASIIFSFSRGDHGLNGDMTPVELPNIKSVEWARDVDNDVAECTITMYNAYDDPVTGEIVRGYYTWNRGDTPYDGGVATEVVEPLVGSVRGIVPEAVSQVTVVGGTATQPFAPAGPASIQVRKINITLPPGQGGRYDVGIRQNSNWISGSGNRWIANGRVLDVQLNAGANTVTLPKAVGLEGQDAGGAYALVLTRRDGARFTVYNLLFDASDGGSISHGSNYTGLTYNLDVGPLSTRSVTRNGVTFLNAEVTPPMTFELIGPAQTRKIGKRNAWYGRLVPDNVIQVFEGYGSDWTVCPERDPNLMLTGTWLIDEVDMSNGMITITCRDFGRILLDQILFPPITPRKSAIPGVAYPVYFERKHQETDTTKSYASAIKGCGYRTSSNVPWTNSPIRGHYGRHAIDTDPSTYWLSVGNNLPNTGHSFEWIEFSVPNTSVASVTLKVVGGPYRCYLSVYAAGHWVNHGMIPYDPNDPVSAPNGADIPFLAQATVGANGTYSFTFGEVKNVTRVRLTFTNLWNSGLGPWVYRAAVSTVSIYPPAAHPKKTVGNYDDYTQIVKLLLAWGGFHWPEKLPFVAISDGTWFPAAARPARDAFLKQGRIYGDLEDSGTNGPSKIDIPDFDKKSLMDAITYIRELVGYIFFIDASGGAVWRAPNFHDPGNKINGVRQQRFLRILDTQTLQDISVRLNGRNIRERFYVGTPNGKIAAGARGWNLNPIGLRRVAGWTDQNFDDPDYDSQKQAQVMANLLAMHTMMSYRTTTLTIAGLPSIEPDDQIEVVDSATGEGFIHWVTGIHSSLDHDSGEYTYSVDTNWLGTRRGDQWFIDNYGKLNPDLQELIDFSDRGRSDGVYDKYAKVQL